MSTCRKTDTMMRKTLQGARWFTVRDMVLDWIVTVPDAGLLARHDIRFTQGLCLSPQPTLSEYSTVSVRQFQLARSERPRLM